MDQRILVIGASGAGTSTLGRRLADALASQHFEVDDFFWQPTDPPFCTRRPAAERLALMGAMFLPRSDWVLSGSPMGWGEPIEARLTQAIFVTLDPDIRLPRLAAREAHRYGARILPGGDRHAAFCGFMDWAAGYDDPAFLQRSREGQRSWLARLGCPLLQLDGARPREALLAEALDWLASPAARARRGTGLAAAGEDAYMGQAMAGPDPAATGDLPC